MSQNVVLPKYLEEMRQPPKLPLQVGDKGIFVKRVQEWLSLHGWACACDGDFGPATRRALMEYQAQHNFPALGEADLGTYAALVAPIIRANAVPGIMEKTFGEQVVRVAQQYQREHACEAGGDNKGPWQRHFSRGRENQPWCQDFASTVWFDAARVFLLNGELLPFALCDENGVASSYVPWVVNEAKSAKRFISGDDNSVAIPVGSMFFVRGTEGYVHVGLVVADNRDGTFKTVEGNTNTDGSSNGWEVAIRFRSKKNCDFGLSIPQEVTHVEAQQPTA
jgi:hypothetical protein